MPWRRTGRDRRDPQRRQAEVMEGTCDRLSDVDDALKDATKKTDDALAAKISSLTRFTMTRSRRCFPSSRCGTFVSADADRAGLDQ